MNRRTFITGLLATAAAPAIPAPLTNPCREVVFPIGFFASDFHVGTLRDRWRDELIRITALRPQMMEMQGDVVSGCLHEDKRDHLVRHLCGGQVGRVTPNARTGDRRVVEEEMAVVRDRRDYLD